MIVVLSQKIDSESKYEDELFKRYHYPVRYRNQLHEGDIFVYYQGNRYDKSQRYYFGMGKIGEISITNENNFYADLLDCQRFSTNIPIYLPSGGYVEQLGYETIRKSINPPWQSSIRPLSQEAFNYILNKAGSAFDISLPVSLDKLKGDLRSAVRNFYVEKNDSAILQIRELSNSIAQKIGIEKLSTMEK